MDDCICLNLVTADLQTPRNELLKGFYKRSFAYHTVKERMPTVITQIIDGLVRSKEQIGEKYGKEALVELKIVIGSLSKLKYEIQTNKPIEPLTVKADDAKFYNNYLKDELDKNPICTFFSTIWLHAECFMYRRIREIFELTTTLQNYDYFSVKKEESFNQATKTMMILGESVVQILNSDDRDNFEDFTKLVKCSLWSNKCDLSLSNGVVGEVSSLLNVIENFEENILCNQITEIWEAANNADNRFQTIDIVLDNAGYELFCDLCLADFLITKKLAVKVRFHVKSIPWFISDVMQSDFTNTLDNMIKSDIGVFKTLGEKWKRYFDEMIYSVEESPFWTTCYTYKDMFTLDESLYRKLARAKLVIFKGDLNYRKLVGERNWDPTTPFVLALEGFYPTRICSLRTLKADLICGLTPGMDEKAAAKEEDWMITGNFGVIQYSDKVVYIR